MPVEPEVARMAQEAGIPLEDVHLLLAGIARQRKREARPVDCSGLLAAKICPTASHRNTFGPARDADNTLAEHSANSERKSV